MIRPTPTGWVVMVAAVLLGGAAFTSQSSLLLLLVGLLLGCVPVNAVIAWWRLRPLELKAPPRTLLCEGEQLPQRWLLENRGARRVGCVQVELPGGQVLFRFPVLTARGEAWGRPEAVLVRRGVYPLERVRLATGYPYGLIRAERRCGLPGEILVGPAVYPAPAPHAAGLEGLLGGTFKSQRRTASGINFAGVRPFQDGDSFRQIHWKSSAKGAGLVVKTFDEELAGRIAFILDSGQAGSPALHDQCLRAAGSLMFAALADGHHLEVLDLDQLEPVRFTPFAGGEVILETLARLRHVPGTLTAERLGLAFERIARRGALCLVLTQWNPAIAIALSSAEPPRRVVSVYLPAASSRAEIPAGLAVFSYSDRAILEAAP